MFRITTTGAVLAVVSLALPAGAGATNIDLAAHAEAHSVVDSAKALQMARASADAAKRLVYRSEDAMARAYHATISQGDQSSEKGLELSAQFGAAADTQSAKLSALVHRSNGGLKTAAAGALAKTGRWESALVSRVAGDLQRQQSASSQQADDVTTVGGDQASVTTTIVLTTSGDGLRTAVRRQLDRVTVLALLAQAKLAAVVAELKQRGEAQGQNTMSDAHSSLQQDGNKVSDAVQHSGRADVSFTVDGGNVTMGDLAMQTADPSASPATVSASGEAHAIVGGGGRR